jgi:uncharacterized membrane protein
VSIASTVVGAGVKQQDCVSMAKAVRDEHYATVIARASAHQLYQIFTRYDQYPQIFRFASTVTPYGGRYLHWEARIFGYNKWEAANDGWIENQQVGWRVTSGWGTSGRICIQPMLDEEACRIHVFIRYQPRGGLFADLADEAGCWGSASRGASATTCAGSRP